MDANRLAFRQWKIVPRVLRPTSPRDLGVTLFGHKYDTPVLMAPIGVHSLYHTDKDIGTANACAALGVPFTLSTAASTGIEELVGQGDEVGFQDPVFRSQFALQSHGATPESEMLAAAAHWTGLVFPGVSHGWDQLDSLRRSWDGPIVLKGILSVEDAKLAVEYGIDGIIISNHGGRQLDGTLATLDVLPDIAGAVGDDITVMLDSGVRTGADILKALALGAKAVFLGRPIVYGLGINGTAGARAVLAGLLADLDLAMGFAGIKRVSELQPSLLRRVQYPGDTLSNL
ncbi:hypothetical protein G6O67_005549 [Ophiocordyceps sinensis]|uniref:FMN hydroxy acid dehydrogenase domain-containing protein n=1 Tax=Ophiocordyceps sinensis TaxID=72228 RepID=A0A8H4PRR0_9HYPO|nr:hypothetical protein G6O67_005549 [Ophiocordyceps sinensis]